MVRLCFEFIAVLANILQSELLNCFEKAFRNFDDESAPLSSRPHESKTGKLRAAQYIDIS
jgi:hypothetical protein